MQPNFQGVPQYDYENGNTLVVQPNFEEMCSFENLLEAFCRARKASPRGFSTLAFSWQLEKNILLLREQLISGTYKHGGYYEFIIHDAKKRHIKAARFRDRVVHQALSAAIEPVFEKLFIEDSYACRKDKGTHGAIRRVEKWIRKDKDTYILACDISKYFDSINHELLLYILNRHLCDKKLVNLCQMVIKSSGDEKGIPIGNLTSQLFANVYLNQLDQYVKRTLSVTRYVRYMDDFLLMGNKEELRYYKEKIRWFLENRLFLTLHPKKANIFPAKQGVTFLGFKVFATHRLLRNDTVRRFLKKYQKTSRGGGGDR